MQARRVPERRTLQIDLSEEEARLLVAAIWNEMRRHEARGDDWSSQQLQRVHRAVLKLSLWGLAP